MKAPAGGNCNPDDHDLLTTMSSTTDSQPFTSYPPTKSNDLDDNVKAPTTTTWIVLILPTSYCEKQTLKMSSIRSVF